MLVIVSNPLGSWAKINTELKMTFLRLLDNNDLLPHSLPGHVG